MRAVFLCVASAAATSLTLSSGELRFDGGPPPAVEGPFVALFSDPRMGTAAADLAAALAGCGSVEAFLPPSSLLFHVASSPSSCLAAASAARGVAAVAFLPPRLRVSPSLAASARGAGAALALELTLA